MNSEVCLVRKATGYLERGLEIAAKLEEGAGIEFEKTAIKGPKISFPQAVLGAVN